MNAKKFKNFTDKEFTWKFDGNPYTFAAGQEIYLEDDKANHFAKHLVDQELNKRGIVTSDVLRRIELTALCFPSDDIVTPLQALNINETTKAVVKKEEVEFPDLQEEKVEEKRPVGRPKKNLDEK